MSLQTEESQARATDAITFYEAVLPNGGDLAVSRTTAYLEMQCLRLIPGDMGTSEGLQEHQGFAPGESIAGYIYLSLVSDAFQDETLEEDTAYRGSGWGRARVVFSRMEDRFVT